MHPTIRIAVSKLRSGSIRAQVARNMSVSLSVKVVSMVGGLLMQLVLARSLGLTEFGIYTFAWAILSTLLIVCKLGFELSSIRFVADYRANREWSLLRGFISRSRLWVAAASIAVGILTALIVVRLPTGSWSEPEVQRVLLVGLPTLPIYALVEVQAGILRGLNKLAYALLTQNALFPLGVAFLMVLIWLLGDNLSSLTAMIVSSAVLAAIAGVQFYQIRRSLPPESSGATSAYRGERWLRVSVAVMASSGLDQFMRQLDILVVGTFVGTAASGIYAVAARFARLVNTGLQISNQSTAHMYTPLYTQGRTVELQKVVSLTTLVTVLTTIPFILILFIWPEQILAVFGSAFSEYGALALQILLIGQFVNAAAGPNGVLMYMTNYQNEMVLILVATFLVEIALLAVLVPTFGLIGVALAVSGSIICRNVLTSVRVKGHLGVNTTAFSPHVWRGLGLP